MIDPGTLDLRRRLSFFAKDTAIYGIGGALNKVLALVTFPLLARHFSVEDYGLIDLLNTGVVLLVTFLVFGQDSAVARYFYEKSDAEYRRQVISQALAFQVVAISISLPVLWIFADRLAHWLSIGDDGELIVRLIALQAPFFLLNNFSQNILKWTFKRWQFLIVSVGSTIVTLVALIVVVSRYELDVQTVFLVYLLTRAVFGLVGLWFVRQWLRWPTGWERLKEMLPFAVPFGIICVISSFLPVFERSFIQSSVGARDLGLYAAGAKAAMLMGIPINALEVSWGPFALALFKQPDAAKTYRAVLKVCTVLLFAMVLALTAVANPLIQILGSARYDGAAIVVFALAMGASIQAIGSMTAIGIVFSKRTYLKLYGYSAMLIVAAAAIPLLSSSLGLVGVAWGSLIAYFAKTALETVLAQRSHPIEWRFLGLLLLGAATLVVGVVHQLTFGYFEIVGISTVPIVGALALLIGAWFSLLDRSERLRILSAIRLDGRR